MKKNLTLLLITLLAIAAVGEITIRSLQYIHQLPNYRKGNISQHPNKIRSPKYIHSKNPILYLEHDTSSPGINQWGTRDPYFTKTKDPTTFRVAVVGDSVSFGYGVKYEESYPYILQTILNKELDKSSIWKHIEVVNFSVSGYALDAYLELYKTKVRFFHPDLVLLGYTQNDPAPTRAVEGAVKDMMLEKKYRLQLAKYSQFAAWIYVAATKIYGGLASKKEWKLYQQDIVLSKTTQQLKQFHNMLIADNTLGMTIIFPYLLDFKSYPLTKVHQVLQQGLELDKFPNCDLLPGFSTVKNIADMKLQGTDTVHLSANGNHIAAKYINQCMLHYFSNIMHTSQTPSPSAL